MKKLISLILCAAILLVSLFCVGCYQKYRYVIDEKDVDTVEIVSHKYDGPASTYQDEIIICEINNISEFLDDLSDVDGEVVGPPMNPLPNSIAIKITYNDGTFEKITTTGKYQTNGLFNGTKHIDEVQFRELINKYMPDTPMDLEYDYYLRKAEINAIEIVELGELDQKRTPELKRVICEIKDLEAFLNDFENVNCYLNENFPAIACGNEKAIRITYNNGCYELIGVSGQSKSKIDDYYYPDGRYPDGGTRYFDNEQFLNLIESYALAVDESVTVNFYK